MARASLLARKLDDITECPICAEPFKDPRELPCLHTFCLECIQKWGVDKSDGDRLACPMCRKEFLVPVGGLANLPKNFFMEKLLEVRKLATTLSVKETPCDVCRAKKDKQGMAIIDPVAVARCIDCAKNMCRHCLRCHEDFMFAVKHKTVEFSAQQQQVSELMQKFPEIRCDQHPDEILKVYCFESECKMPLCMMCYITKHSGHKCSEVEKVAEEMSRQMKHEADGFSGKVAEIHELLQKLAIEKIELVLKACNAENEIEKRAAEMKQLIDEIVVKEMEQVNVARKQQEKKIESLREELDRRLLMIDSFVRYSEELRSKGTAVDIARTANSLHDRANELMQFDVRKLFDEQFSPLDIKFMAGTIKTDFDLRFLFGQIVIQSAGLSSVQTSSAKDNLDIDGDKNQDVQKSIEKMDGTEMENAPEREINRQLKEEINTMELTLAELNRSHARDIMKAAEERRLLDEANKKLQDEKNKLEEHKKIVDENSKLEQRLKKCEQLLSEEKTKHEQQKQKNRKLDDDVINLKRGLQEEFEKLIDELNALREKRKPDVKLKESTETPMEERKEVSVEALIHQLNDDKIKLQEENEKLRGKKKKLEQEIVDLRSPKLLSTIQVPGAGNVMGVTQCDDKLFVVCKWSNIIQVFGPDNRQLPGIPVNGLKNPNDIVACTESKQIYVADRPAQCVWRLSLGGRVKQWLTSSIKPTTSRNSFNPWTLSMTSRRLLVTSEHNGLFQFGDDGVELKHIRLSDMALQHSVETSCETFVVCYSKQGVVEVDADGQVIFFYGDQQLIGESLYLALDCQGRVLVADGVKHRVLLLTCGLELQRVLLDDTHKLRQSPKRLCYVERTRQLVVSNGCDGSIQIFKMPG